jgi:hypothetical protein
MARLYLADSQRTALARLGQMTEEDATRLIAAFDQLDAYLTLDELAGRAVEVVPSLAPVDDLIVTLLGLATETRDLESDEVTELLRDALVAELPANGAVDVGQVVRMIARLTSTTALRTSANAHEVLAQHDRNYQSVRIFTDLRPLFGADPDSGQATVRCGHRGDAAA